MASCSGVGAGLGAGCVAGAACPASHIAPEKTSAKTANLQQVILNIGNLIS
jgi:hypothetical protein